MRTLIQVFSSFSFSPVWYHLTTSFTLSLILYGVLVLQPSAPVEQLPSDISKSSVTLIGSSTQWKYHDLGQNLGTSWRYSSYSDGGWKTGYAEFGYGDGDEKTIVSYGTNSSSKYITTYFRRKFYVSDVSAFSQLKLEIKRDDGAVVYVNGVEAARFNMPSGTIYYNTLASSAVDGSYETSWYTKYLSKSLVTNGYNTIAVEVHQGSPSSSDLSFNLRLSGVSSSITLTRGPYLQLATPSSIYIRWRTNVPSPSKVKIGSSNGNYTRSITDTNKVTEHVMRVRNLYPNTKYYYTIGTTQSVLQGNSENFFITPPVAGTVKPVRIWVIGDAGSGFTNQNLVRDAYYRYSASRYTDVWLWLGDNAYEYGSDSEYQRNVFTGHYEKMLKQTVAWPAAGNHDLKSASAGTQSGVYYSIFTLPKNGEAGGVPSGTEAYYSFNYANIHFVCLESTTGSFRAIGSNMYNWLNYDLSQNKQRWVVVYFHHPPYSKGSHDSDWEVELKEMRVNLTPLFDKYGVDLVLSGHSHSYERTPLIKNHRGTESTFTSSNIVAGGSGSLSSPYFKSTSGTLYAVCGSSGKLGGTSSGYPHNATVYNNVFTCGSMVIDVNGDELTARFLTANDVIADEFMIRKSTLRSEADAVAGITNIKIFPNPFSDVATVSYTLASPEVVEISIFDQAGRIVYVSTTSQQKGDNTVTLLNPLKGKASGVYIVSVKTRRNIQTHKVFYRGN